jgi:hypothetical protein
MGGIGFRRIECTNIPRLKPMRFECFRDFVLWVFASSNP